MERMIIKHLSGSKANQVEEFAVKHYNELSFGRDPSSVVQYDADRDDLVGREHAKLERDPNNEEQFLLTDLNSRNGTFLNDKKISGTVQVHPGDTVQFGPNGPKFEFDVEPRPKNATKPTRIVETGKNAPPTRVVDNSAIGATAGAGGDSDSIITKPATKTSVGKATVERMISHNVAETRQQERSNFAKIGGAAAVAVLLLFGVVIGGAYWYNSSQEAARLAKIEQAKKDAQLAADQKVKTLQEDIDKDKANAPKAASEISAQYEKSVVYITGSWHLQNTESKSQIYHQFIPNSREHLTKLYKQDFGKGPIVPNGGNAIPMYIEAANNKVEPILTDEKNELSVPIGASGYSGSGFIVTENGFILTNRHVAAPWKAAYPFPDNYPAGVLFSADGQIKGLTEPPRDWIPENTSSVPRQFQGKFEATSKLRVQLPGSDNPVDAQFISSSPRHDVGMIKIDVPGNLKKVVIHNDFDALKKGEELVVMGYPGTAPKVYGVIQSKDMLNPETKLAEIPDPTTSITSIGNIVRTSTSDVGEDRRFSRYFDVIRYAVSLTGGGNSGGPVFDMQGRVIGIHFAGDGRQAGFAVPIKYGVELLNTN